MYLEQINIFLGAYVSLKRIDNVKLRFKPKPWITLDLQKPVKYKLLTKFNNTKDPIFKVETHIKYKNCRNS